MNNTEKMLIADGYDFQLCFMGKPFKTYRITFRGEYFATAETYKNVLLKCIFHQDERTTKIL